MPLKTSCPACKQVYNLPENLVGKKVKCKACNKAFTIADPKQAPPDDEPVEVALADDGDEEPRGGLFDRAKKRNAGRSRDADADDDDDDRPARRRSRDEEDEDDRPSRRRSRDDEDEEDDRPSKRRARDEEDEDDRPRKKKKKKAKGGMPAWAWIVIGVGGLLGVGLLVVVLIFAVGGGAVTEENYAKVRMNMSGDEVKKILGSPHETEADAMKELGAIGFPLGGMNVWGWKSGSNEIVIFLQNNRVVSKHGKFGNKTMQQGNFGGLPF